MSEPAPSDRRYAESHEWHQLGDDGVVTIGISRHAVEELSDVTYVDFLVTEGAIKAGETFGEVESVKATSELYSAIDGEVVAVNAGLGDDPEPINADCYGAGWLIKVRPDDPAAVESLLTSEAYDQSVGG